MESPELAPGKTPGTAVAGMSEHSGQWLGWVRIMPHERLTPEQHVAAGDIDHVVLIGGMLIASTAAGMDNTLMISIASEPSAEQAKATIDRVVEAVGQMLGYSITIESYADGE